VAFLALESNGQGFFISLIAFLGLNAVAGIVLISQNRSLMTTLFETTSASTLLVVTLLREQACHPSGGTRSPATLPLDPMMSFRREIFWRCSAATNGWAGSIGHSRTRGMGRGCDVCRKSFHLP
jgi:hypothetical protein